MSKDDLLIESAREAADLLFDAREGDNLSTYEPASRLEAKAAVQQLCDRFEGLPGAISVALGAARESANLISRDRLQGLAEIIQNADDVDASQVRIALEPEALWISHNGRPVQLRHVLGFATPWLSTKGGESDTTGRFGIGLMTLRSLSNSYEIHCEPYHVKLGEPTLFAIDPPLEPAGLAEMGWTTLRVPLAHGAVSLDALTEWLDRWDDSALLFLRSVSSVTLVDGRSGSIRALAIDRKEGAEVLLDEKSPDRQVIRSNIEAEDGRRWIVYAEDVPTPTGVTRARKAAKETTPIAIAFPQYSVDHGQIHAGLPVAETRFPIFVNAQFDPLTSRSDFADNDWNRAILPLVSMLWSLTALDLFSRDPRAGWRAIPIPASDNESGQLSFTARLEEAIIAKARTEVASQLSFSVQGHDQMHLSSLAVEAEQLESIVTEEETAELAELPATLPFAVRDQDGRWRLVLDDWRTYGTDIADEVSIEKALHLVGNENRSVESTIALTAAGLAEQLNSQLLRLPCVVARDGRHLVPPDRLSANALAVESTPLADQLGSVTLLHPAYFVESEHAGTVLAWLRESRALLQEVDDLAVVRRLAAAGSAGQPIVAPLNDEQVRALRAAFELMDPDERKELGPNVGRAVWLRSFEYESRGRKRIRKDTYARPIDAYMPRTVDRETDGFPVSAGQTPGITWLSEHYGRILRSPAGRQGVGAQRFLTLLGAETAPRLRPHPQLEQRYADPRRGVTASLTGGPTERRRELEAQDASYTLQDRDCPDLVAVAHEVSSMGRNRRERRIRAAALLTTLARTWDRTFSELSSVESARDYNGWQSRSHTAAYWIWELRAISWLDDESGIPRRPSELRVKTPGNVAIYGQEFGQYLHPDLNRPNLRPVLDALGVAGDPSVPTLLERLKQIRNEAVQETAWTPDALKRESAVIYKALAQSLTTATPRLGRESARLRRDFQYRGGLIHSNIGWLPPQGVLAGPPVFGNYKAFVPELADTDQLWAALRLREPSFEDCVEVIRSVARKRSKPEGEDETILLETLRLLHSLVSSGTTIQERSKLRRLPLWTSMGWTRSRPVFAIDDPILAEGLSEQLSLWLPGGELQQFRSLIDVLGIEEIRTASAEVVDPDLATKDEYCSELLVSALMHLREDLSRNAPQLEQGLSVSWDHLERYEVRVHPSLSVRVSTERNGSNQPYECGVMAKVDKDMGILFVQSPDELARVDTGGRAIATLFTGDQRQLSQSWRAALDRAEARQQARVIELAEQRTKREQERNESEIAHRTEEFRTQTSDKHRASTGDRAGKAGTLSAGSNAASQQENRGVSEVTVPPRVLVDPQSVWVVDPMGRLEKRQAVPDRKPVRERQLAEPRLGTDALNHRSSIRVYTDKEREDVGMELLKKLLRSNDAEISDLRAQHGVGADAIDAMDRFFELKVHAGSEPDHINMTASEVQRARTTPGFFLAVVSGVEGADARPNVRIIVDPLDQLKPTETGSITLAGVRNSESLVYTFAPADDVAEADKSGETSETAEEQ